MIRDYAPEIARYVLCADTGIDPRERVFGILRCFPHASGEEVKRGMLIAVELYEVSIMEDEVRTGPR